MSCSDCTSGNWLPGSPKGTEEDGAYLAKGSNQEDTKASSSQISSALSPTRRSLPIALLNVLDSTSGSQTSSTARTLLSLQSRR